MVMGTGCEVMRNRFKFKLGLSAIWPAGMLAFWALFPYTRQNVPAEYPLVAGVAVSVLFIVLTLVDSQTQSEVEDDGSSNV